MMSDDMKVSKGLGFPVVALTGVGYMPAKGEDEQEATRATQRLVIGVGGDGGWRTAGNMTMAPNRNETTNGTFADSIDAEPRSLIANGWQALTSETVCSAMHNVVRCVSVLN